MINLFRYIFLLALALITITPLWVMVVTSFSAKPLALEDMVVYLKPNEITLNNFKSVWQGGNFNRYFLNSLLVSVSITVANLLFDSMVAYALARRHFWGQKLVYGAIALKLMIPAAVLMVPTFLLMKTLHLYDTYLSLILPMVTETFGIYVLFQAVKAIPKDFEEAARLEGMGDIRIFFSILMPLLSPSLTLVAIQSFLNSWNMYLYPLILTSQDKLRTLPLGINFYLSSHPSASLGEFMASAVITATPILLLFLLLQKKMISSLTQGALKE